jgi:hypothetical protein
MQVHTHHTSKTVDRSNRISAILSLACAIHCALMPIVFSALPLVGMQFLASHLLEGIILALGLGFGAYGVLKAYFYQHRYFPPVAVLGVGAVLIGVGFFFAAEAIEPFLVSIGAVCVAVAQVLNIRECKRCAH